ncbi:uncharacterized protein kif16bb [Centropristis striata]|uniref:uncharacterized protein kif16bb n=1 Tax=Centropristis striata TaxID=184440 RepID=UPI0027E1B96E|nr:uncharacterized protein kif16bb [Centropristis striata]
MASVRVAVRVRPLNKREKQLSSKVIIHMKGNSTTILKPSPVQGDELKDREKTFSYDFSYESTDRRRPTFTSQERVYQDLGTDVLQAAFEGFNACVFAYGQTGSGKSYTMMGHTDDKGLIPRICEGLFNEISRRGKNDAVSYRTEVSYLEIYNERVHDLLKKRPTPTDGGLRVREHPKDGPYVENLSKHLVYNHSDMEDLIILGNGNRTTASTGMNDVSSRSHAIFTIRFIQAWFDAELPRETLSKIHLVDLAGSERADATRATGTRLKEGANINKSLGTLGTVISALADLGVGGQSTKKKKQIFIPYRDSVLTWLLKDSLGGNAVTTMIATVSPADVNYGETLSTLRYASRAKTIVNSPTVNEDGSVKVIRELQAEVTRLRRLLEEAHQVSHREPSCSVKMEEELHQNEARVLALTKEWTSKWGETQSILQEETVALRKEGSGVVLGCQLPHLIGIDEDLLSTGIVLYYLKEGRTLIGSDEASCRQDIVLHGPGLLSEHCVLENRAGTVTLIPQDGALCSVNGSVVTDPCQLTQGAITQLGRGTIFRFNHPTEVAQLREKRQSRVLSTFSLSLTDMSKSTEDLSKVMLQNPGRMEEKLNQQEVGWQQVQENLNRRNRDIKRRSKENSGAPHHQRAEEKTTGAEMEDTGSGQMDILAPETAESKAPGSCLTSATIETIMTAAIPGKYPVPHSGFDGDTLQGGISTRDGQEQDRDSCHKSGPGLMSEWPWRKAQSGSGDASFKEEEVWSGDASLQQTSVLGPGDGCGMKPEGNANEIKGVWADCYKERPGSGGSSLGCMSHLQSSRGTISTSVLSQTSTHSQLDKRPLSSQAACRPPEETTFKGQFGCGEMDESGGLEEIPGVCVTETAAATVQRSGLGSWVSRFSCIVQDAGRILRSSPTVLQQVRAEGLQPVGARWSSHVVSLVRESNVLSVVRDSEVFSMVKGSFVFSLLKDSHIFSVVKDLPLIQHIQMEITQSLQPEQAAQMIQGCINPDATQTFSEVGNFPEDGLLISEDTRAKNKSIRDLQLPQEPVKADTRVKHGDKLIIEVSQVKHISEEVTHEDQFEASETLRTVQINNNVQIFGQTLVEFPDSFLNLQALPLPDMMDTLQSIISTSVLPSQKILALYWLNVAKCSQPEPRPALLILAETGLYTLTSDSGLLVLFHYLPLLQLKEVQIGLAGHSLRLMGTTEESILGVYTHSQQLTKELCWALLGIICREDNRVSQHPLLHGDLMDMSLHWQACVPDLLLDAGLRVCCQFQKSLADLVYLLHCNMDQETVTLGEVQILLYTGVRVLLSPSTHTESLAQLLLTDTHLGLVQEDAVFHPPPRSVTVAPCHPQFSILTLRQRSNVRCVLVHDEDKRRAVSLDVILANVRGRGHPESVTKAATPPAQASNSSPHAEVWKLTFSCSSEAACLINHLSNV